LIVLDTSVLVDALSGPRRSGKALRDAIEAGHRIAVPALVLYEWLRGPRLSPELVAQESLFPSASALAFGPDEGAVAARLYRRLRGARGREIDLAIAAHAIVSESPLWTLNRDDFEDVPDLELW
jgi:predicted nucleic acid-binding protein